MPLKFYTCIVVALEHNEYDLYALCNKLCSAAYCDHAFNNFCIPGIERQIRDKPSG